MKFTIDDWEGLTVAGSILAFLRAKASRNINAKSPRRWGAKKYSKMFLCAFAFRK